jgi:hypothetical protein
MTRPGPIHASGARVIALLAVALLGVGCSEAPAPVVLPTATPGGPASSAVPGESVAAPSEPSPTEAPIPTEAASAVPGSSVTPDVTTLTVVRTASCTSDNGTGTVGLIRLTWSAEGTTGVRVSIDPPSPAQAYAFGYADYAAVGSADVPFACSPPNHDTKGDYHLYVVTTIHASGYAAYRFAKVYQAP